jgi:Acetylornithine deacetylase/Succinyl-diaminopimelate desuccinylase and related deacylases
MPLFMEKAYFCITMNNYISEALPLLQALIRIPSTSRDESQAASYMVSWMEEHGLRPELHGNNILLTAPDYDERRPTLLLNAHIDTVKPVSTWTRDPFGGEIEGDRLYGLGSNDCGGGLVTLLQVFRRLSERERPYNLLYVASAEEEVSGENGFRSVLPLLPHVDVALVGEPTGMQPAVAERGLMVLDVVSHGISGHAARGEGKNAIVAALKDLEWLSSYRFEKESALLGPTTMQVTVIHAGTQHNVVPDRCEMVVDVRTNECYANEEVFAFIQEHVTSDVTARSTRLQSSHIPLDHPLVKRCVELGRQPFGSPTLSDQALMPFTSLKMGPGNSARSHSADEFIRVSELEEAFALYLKLLETLNIER